MTAEKDVQVARKKTFFFKGGLPLPGTQHQTWLLALAWSGDAHRSPSCPACCAWASLEGFWVSFLHHLISFFSPVQPGHSSDTAGQWSCAGQETADQSSPQPNEDQLTPDQMCHNNRCYYNVTSSSSSTGLSSWAARRILLWLCLGRRRSAIRLTPLNSGRLLSWMMWFARGTNCPSKVGTKAAFSSKGRPTRLWWWKRSLRK